MVNLLGQKKIPVFHTQLLCASWKSDSTYCSVRRVGSLLWFCWICLICPTLQLPEKNLAFCVLKTPEYGWGLEVGRDGWSFIILCIIAAVYFSKDLDGWCHLQISERTQTSCAFFPSAEEHPTIGTVDCLACSFCSFLDNKNTYTSCIVHLVNKWQLMFKDIKTI